MDRTIIIPLICAGISAIVALITTLLTQRLSKKQSLEQDYDKALEELQKLYLDVKMHIEEEIRSWWLNMGQYTELCVKAESGILNWQTVQNPNHQEDTNDSHRTISKTE